jgi:hypothetical protein
VGKLIDCTSYFELEQAEYAAKGITLSVEAWLVKLMVSSSYHNVCTECIARQPDLLCTCTPMLAAVYTNLFRAGRAADARQAPSSALSPH